MFVYDMFEVIFMDMISVLLYQEVSLLTMSDTLLKYI